MTSHARNFRDFKLDSKLVKIMWFIPLRFPDNNQQVPINSDKILHVMLKIAHYIKDLTVWRVNNKNSDGVSITVSKQTSACAKKKENRLSGFLTSGLYLKYQLIIVWKSQRHWPTYSICKHWCKFLIKVPKIFSNIF